MVESLAILYAFAKGHNPEKEDGSCEVSEADLGLAREFFDYCRSIGSNANLAVRVKGAYLEGAFD